MPDRVLPSFVSRPVVRIVLGDVTIDPRQSELFVRCTSYRLDDQLRIRIWRFRIVFIATASPVAIVYHNRRYRIAVRGRVPVGVGTVTVTALDVVTAGTFVSPRHLCGVRRHHLQVRRHIPSAVTSSGTRRTTVGRAYGASRRRERAHVHVRRVRDVDPERRHPSRCHAAPGPVPHPHRGHLSHFGGWLAVLVDQRLKRQSDICTRKTQLAPGTNNRSNFTPFRRATFRTTPETDRWSRHLGGKK
jgi:hypothetical protein